MKGDWISCSIPIACESWNSPAFYPLYSALVHSLCYRGHGGDTDQNVLNQIHLGKYWNSKQSLEL